MSPVPPASPLKPVMEQPADGPPKISFEGSSIADFGDVKGWLDGKDESKSLAVGTDKDTVAVAESGGKDVVKNAERAEEKGEKKEGS